MGIEIETPEEFLEEFEDPSYFKSALDKIISKSYISPFIPLHFDNTEEKLKNSLNKAIEYSLKHSEKYYWNGEMESNYGLNAQFILMSFGLKLNNKDKLYKLFNFILEKKEKNGLYSLYYEGPPHYSTNLLIYLAGRILGYSPQSPELKVIYEYLKSNDITKNINMETRLLLAVYGLISWECVPSLHPYLILLPPDGDFSIYSISYWIRTSLVPMLILYSKKYTFDNFPLKKDEIRDLLPSGIDEFPKFESSNKIWDMFLSRIKKTYLLDKNALEKLAVKKCEEWIIEHQDYSGDWGGIYPAMQYSIIALYSLGYSISHPIVKKGLEALERFQLERENTIHQQACVSPVWDTAWSLIALDRAGCNVTNDKFIPYFDWLVKNQIIQKGDWAIRNKTGFGGGWAFQFYNAWYPDIDDSAVVIMALLKFRQPTQDILTSLQIGIRWILSMQNLDGGWSAFEQGVDDDYVDVIPFNDMENWKDPSTADITGRCVQMLGELGVPKDFPPIIKALNFLEKRQEKGGSWFGRWGVNYIYGTWSVLMGITHFLDKSHSMINKAVKWLKSIQNPDGGWGECCSSYDVGKYVPLNKSTASQTAWALLSLLVAGEVNSESVKKGIKWLIENQTSEGSWKEEYFTGTGFPKHFYLRYDFYRHYFPLWALGEYLRRK